MRSRKTYIALSMGMLAVGLTLFAAPITAQSIAMHAMIPFSFYAAGKLMPAGSYTAVLEGNSRTVIRLNDGRGNSVLVSAFPTGNKRDIGRIVFTSYGDLTFLSELHWQGYDTGREVLKSALELEARNNAAGLRVAVIPQK